jgi:hypothetical protein
VVVFGCIILTDMIKCLVAGSIIGNDTGMSG